MDRDSPARTGDDLRLALALVAALLVAETIHALRRGDASAATPRFAAHVVDVNSAPAGEIEALPGVGRVLAERIVAERARGAFASVEDLVRVGGVGPTTLARMRPFVRCGEER